MKRIDAAIPKRMYWSDRVEGSSRCPKCRSKLEHHFQVYAMAVRDEYDVYSYVVGNTAGYFCLECPTVVLDREEFTDFAVTTVGSNPRAQFAVLGIVNLDAVPEEKKSEPFDEDDNPLPLVKFINYSGSDRKGQSKTAATRKRRRKRKGKSG
ncbi:MAG: hypothetical protein V2B18_22440 [Pseudomonadota bacterium]